MKEASAKLWKHPFVLGAIAVTAVIIVGSGLYYVVATREPDTQNVSATASTTETEVTGSGTVEPAQNPNLAFISGGRVVRVNVAVGDKVTAGQTLASLDIGTLAAQRANAQANLASQEANLAQMKAGPRGVDTQPKQTAVDQANQTLQNAYANISATINKSHDQALSGISTYTDVLFNQANTQTPTLVFNTTNSQASTNAVNGRATANNTIQTWGTEIATLSSASSPQELDTALSIGITNLQVLQNYSSAVLSALSGAISTSDFSQSSITSAQAAVGTLRDTINNQILALQGIQQQLASDKLSVKSAQDALNLTLAGVTSQAIDAQQAQVDAASANVALYNAQIANALITAPFSGTVSSVRIKPGDIATANTPAISLNPQSALQVAVYFSEIEITKIKVGAPANVTLDAYGSSKTFPAQVVSVDTSPTQGGTTGPSGYKATLQFLQTDPAVSTGMTANVIIPIAQ